MYWKVTLSSDLPISLELLNDLYSHSWSSSTDVRRSSLDSVKPVSDSRPRDPHCAVFTAVLRQDIYSSHLSYHTACSMTSMGRLGKPFRGSSPSTERRHSWRDSLVSTFILPYLKQDLNADERWANISVACVRIASLLARIYAPGGDVLDQEP
jgi:hypothetical protein